MNWVIEGKLKNEEDYHPIVKFDDLVKAWSVFSNMKSSSKSMEYNLRQELPGDDERISKE